MNEVLKKIVDTAEMYRRFLDLDVAIAISDTENFIKILNTKTIKLPYKEGDKNDENFRHVIDEMIDTGKSVTYIVPKEITGEYTIRSISSPILDGKDYVGFILLTFNYEKEGVMEAISAEITNSIEIANNSAQNILTSADRLNQMMRNIEEWTLKAEESVNLSNNAIELIKGIATQSNLLGLNASIEASRSAQSGNGFSVVASEMRKLAGQSKDTSQKVEIALKEVEKSILVVLDAVKEARKISDNEFVEIRQISEMIKNISQKSNDLVEHAKLKSI